jgi:hypothetical protein
MALYETQERTRPFEEFNPAYPAGLLHANLEFPDPGIGVIFGGSSAVPERLRSSRGGCLAKSSRLPKAVGCPLPSPAQGACAGRPERETCELAQRYNFGQVRRRISLLIYFIQPKMCHEPPHYPHLPPPATVPKSRADGADNLVTVQLTEWFLKYLSLSLSLSLPLQFGMRRRRPSPKSTNTRGTSH